jgi:hypothetical protein
MVAAMTRRGASRQRALALMTERYIEHMRTNEPVHAWPVTPLGERPKRPERYVYASARGYQSGH